MFFIVGLIGSVVGSLVVFGWWLFLSRAPWLERAVRRRAAVDRYLWDAKSGLYLDYDFRRGRRRHYEFATTFYPLWVGLASKAQARRSTGRSSSGTLARKRS